MRISRSRRDTRPKKSRAYSGSFRDAGTSCVALDRADTLLTHERVRLRVPAAAPKVAAWVARAEDMSRGEAHPRVHEALEG